MVNDLRGFVCTCDFLNLFPNDMNSDLHCFKKSFKLSIVNSNLMSLK